jgi:glycosyltransferase involved in cell wall biosynthesis
MRLLIVGPGEQSIPPKGWGAVESLIWDYYQFITKFHPDITVHIVNEKDQNILIDSVNSFSPDVVHLQYDNHIQSMRYIKSKLIIITSHYGYIDQIGIRDDTYDYMKLFLSFINSGFHIFCLSASIRDKYIEYGCSNERLHIHHNGANETLFKYIETPLYTDRSIYLAKIDNRKRQYIYQNIPTLFFAGNIADNRFDITSPRYLGEWSKEYLYDHLSEYANLVLLSDGEAHALVCCEALMCGLGLVISEYACANLDTSLPFIDVIPADKLDDLAYVYQVIQENRIKSVSMRDKIRTYGLTTFSWNPIIDKYIDTIKILLNQS